MYGIRPLIKGHVPLFVLGLLTALIWSSCGSVSGPEGISKESRPVVTAQAAADVVIVETGAPRLTRAQPVPGHVVLAPGETIGLSAIGFDQEGRDLFGTTFSWQVADPQAGSITPSGVFRAGFTKGTFTDALVVTAQSPAGVVRSSVQGTASVTVAELNLQLRPTNVRVFPNKAEVEPRETLSLLALAVDANGLAIPNMKFKWEMLEPLAGSITEDGRLTVGTNIGTFPGAVKVTLTPREGDGTEVISTHLDVNVLDPANAEQRISAIVLPQVISLRPNEQMRFASIVLDRRGNQITPTRLSWEVTDKMAGVISQEGHFRAGPEPDVYQGAVKVSMSIPGIEQDITATGTVLIVDVAPLRLQPVQSARVTIFPNVVVLSPGESTRVSIISQNSDIRPSATNIRWSLDPPEVGEVSQFVNVTANDFPGLYEDAIRAVVTLETAEGPVTHEVSASLIIRGPLTSVDVVPSVATLPRGEKIGFRAVAYDENGVLLPDVFFRWSIADPAAGKIDSSGLFTAEGRIGEYPGAVQVEAVQRGRAP